MKKCAENWNFPKGRQWSWDFQFRFPETVL